MKPVDETGQELDAIFTVETVEGGVALVLESRGGAEGGPQPPRNADYLPALELLLHRLGAARAVLASIEVDSRVTRSWAPQDRRLRPAGYPLPLSLADVTDVRDLRIQIGRQSTLLGRVGDKPGGNSTKRLRLTLTWAGGVPRSAAELEDLLAGRQQRRAADTEDTSRYAPLGAYLRSVTASEVRLRLSEIEAMIGGALPQDAWTPQFWANASGYHTSRRGQWLNAGFSAFFERRTEMVLFRRVAAPATEAPTADPDELRTRARRAKARMETRRGSAPPRGSSSPARAETSVARYIRDPEVVAWVLVAAKGSCEVCGEAAPFLSVDGEPFLEVHHMRPLGEGGPDQTDNAVAACPNCHRRLHYGAHRNALRETLIGRITRLRDYPATSGG